MHKDILLYFCFGGVQMGIYISKLTDSPSAAVNTQSQPQANGEFKALMLQAEYTEQNAATEKSA